MFLTWVGMRALSEGSLVPPVCPPLSETSPGPLLTYFRLTLTSRLLLRTSSLYPDSPDCRPTLVAQAVLTFTQDDLELVLLRSSRVLGF